MEPKTKIEEKNLVIGIDPNKDGEKVLNLKLNLSEALGEAMARGEAVEGAKLVDVKFEMTKLVLVLDTDKDGERLLEMELDLGEAFDEVQSLLKKK